MIKTVNAVQLREWLGSGEAVLVDVREPGEYQAEHIGQAYSVPLSTLSVDKLPEHTGKKLVFQCRSGKRSGMACEKVAALNTGADIYSLDGGIGTWINAGYPVKSSGRFFLPLDRQVQLTAGLCVLFGTLMVYAGYPGFLLLTGFFGVGLSIAGLTGFCGLAMIFARMPWNQSTAKTCQWKPEAPPTPAP